MWEQPSISYYTHQYLDGLKCIYYTGVFIYFLNSCTVGRVGADYASVITIINYDFPEKFLNNNYDYDYIPKLLIMIMIAVA